MELMKLVLNDSQLDRLSEFTANLALLFFAPVIAPLFYGIDERSAFVVGLGLVLTVGCLIISLFLLKGVKK